jgi:hypothetical protein
MAYNKPRRPRKFEEEEKPAEATTDTTAEGGEEASTPDAHEQFINILVEMGLSADQAEAVHQMAMDLVNAGGKEETPATEMSAHRRRALRAANRRREMGRDNRETEVRQPKRRPMRTEFGSDRPARRPQREDRREFGAERMEVMMRRQRREIMELKRQLMELGAQPAARPERVQQQFTTTAPKMTAQGSILDRVKSYIDSAK